MIVRHFIIVTILCVLGLAPALSFAQGCCCMKDMSVKAAVEQPPCHAEKPADAPSKICLCDAGLSSVPLLTSQAQFYTPVAFSAGLILERAQPALVKRALPLFRPPILLS